MSRHLPSLFERFYELRMLLDSVSLGASKLSASDQAEAAAKIASLRRLVNPEGPARRFRLRLPRGFQVELELGEGPAIQATLVELSEERAWLRHDGSQAVDGVGGVMHYHCTVAEMSYAIPFALRMTSPNETLIRFGGVPARRRLESGEINLLGVTTALDERSA